MGDIYGYGVPSRIGIVDVSLIVKIVAKAVLMSGVSNVGLVDLLC